MPRDTDIDLAENVASVLSRPRADPPDSFVLHAPLELLARAALLPHVSAGAREGAHRQMESIAERFEAFAAPADDLPIDFADDLQAMVALQKALTDGDLELAAAAGRHLGRALDADELCEAVGDLLTPSLAAAAHGPIFLHHLPRAMPRSPLAGTMFGTLAREVARHPDWVLRWHQEPLTGTGELAVALAHTPVLGSPGSDFIRPLMVQAEDSGLAAEVVGGAVGPQTDPRLAARTITRIAAASMLVDDSEHAPYGWSHCLTIPQGILSTLATTSSPAETVALAATHVVGFRAALGSQPLAEIDGPGGRIGADALFRGIARPAPATLQAAVDFAATHEDAHLTKYLVSCMDASRRDPGGADQYLAAAVHLADWWRAAEH